MDAADSGCEMEAMGAAYVELLGDRDRLLFQMQSYAACSDPVIQERVRAGYGDIVREVTRLSGEPPEKVWQFFATGMLLNVIASLDLPAIAAEDAWAAAWCEPGDLARVSLGETTRRRSPGGELPARFPGGNTRREFSRGRTPPRDSLGETRAAPSSQGEHAP